jgi:hypothetical protein
LPITKGGIAHILSSSEDGDGNQYIDTGTDVDEDLEIYDKGHIQVTVVFRVTTVTIR